MPDVVDIADALAVIEDALDELDEYAQQETNGIWLEDMTVRVAPLLRDWNVDHCWRWEDWPDRAEVMPEGTPDRRPGKSLLFPFYNPAVWRSLPIPDLSDQRICSVLADSWEATRLEVVPQFHDGYTGIRRRWDDAVCAALGWDVVKIAELGRLLAHEPAVRGVAYGEWKP